MELKFEKTGWPCLMTAAAHMKNEEQTQEVRLGDHMPDVGRVLGAWGQVLLRGKEWRGAGMAVSAGVMVWVLYAPEDGTNPQLVETWIPVQLKWEFPETKHDGSILVNCQLASVDARSVSARKLMVRAVVSAFGEAVVPDLVDVWTPGNVPEDVQLLKRSYPIRLPREAGEKSFALDEEFAVPVQAEKVLYYTLRPEIMDTNVVAGKVVFRGVAQLHLLYEDMAGNLKGHDQEFHFSQFADLDQAYDTDTRVRVVPAVTNLELELLSGDQMHMKAGLLGQFVVSDQPMLEVVEDAYGIRRPVEVHLEQLMIPAELDQNAQTMRLSAEEAMEGDRILDAAFLCGQPRIRRDENGVTLEQSGVFQVLYESGGEIKGALVHAEGENRLLAGENSAVQASSLPVGVPQAVLSNRQVNLRSDTMVSTLTTSDRGIPMVMSLTLGEMTQADPQRPSMILRRCNGQGLWEIAKASGSTVDEIIKINQLPGEPEESRLLLIPVL